MTTKTAGIKVSNLILALTIVVLYIATFNTASANLKPLGFTAVFGALSAGLVLMLFKVLKNKQIHKVHLFILLVVAAFIGVMIVGMFGNFDDRSFIAIYQLLTVLGFFALCSLIKWDKQKVRMAKWISVLCLLALPSLINPLFLGPPAVFALFFIFLQRKKSLINLILIIFCFWAIDLAGMRGIYLLIGSSLAVYILWKFISKNRFRFTAFFVTVFAGIISFIFVYQNLIYQSWFPRANEFMFQYTGKRILSGRDVIWKEITEAIKEKPLLGYGTGIQPSQVVGIDISSHNLYLQTAMQNGLVGLFLLLTIFFIIWMTYFNSRDDYMTRLSASVFIGILIYQTFEVALTQNKMDNALMFWLMISVGVSRTIYKKASGETS